MIEVNRDGEVWVFAEQQDGKLNEVSLELLGRGKVLADKLSVTMAAVLPGYEVNSLADELGAYGAEKVYLVQDPLLHEYQTTSYAKVLCNLITRHKPQIVLYGATAIGRDLAPRIASAMRAGLTADCTDLLIEDFKPPRSDQVHKNLLQQIRPAFGGNIIATIVNYDRWPQMATVREGVMPLPSRNGKLKAEIIPESVELSPEYLPLKILERHTEQRKVNLKASRIIVAGGAGLGSRENFRLVWDLANALGGAPGASRAAVDLGFIDHDYQVGQTGTTVRPALYIAVGISGAVQHCAGMSQSAKIVAINNDPEAPIFQMAHYGIAGDLNDVIPMLIKSIKERK
ncbi:MAG: electron transfer flavoprotein subunit alpha/FixB family protein [Sedimentisphaerales bacterium]|nr:electron transfer flavoprotein subunit alpha/FixB family protein [Sedimentisphaerales bacterium]